MTILTELDTFITGLRNDVITKVLDSNLPLVGSGLQSASASALQFLDTLKSQLDSALSGAPSTAQGIADALNAAHISGVTASVDATGKVILNLSESATVDVALPTAPLDFGTSAFGLDAQATFDAIIKPALNISLSFDPSGATGLALVDSATPEVSVGVGIAVDVSNGSGGPAQANLGLLHVTVTDNVPATTPEINLDFGLNFDSLTNFTPTASGSIDTDLKIVTSIIPELPTIGADLVVHWGFNDGDAGTPTIQFEHVQVGLGSLLSELVKTIKPILDFFGSYPFDQIIHTLTDPLPIIGHLPEQLPLLSGPNGLDPIPSTSGDGIINFLDLGAILSHDPDQVASISKFAEALAIIEQLVTLNQQATGQQMIDLGSFKLLPGNTADFTGGTDPLQQVNAFISSIKNPAIFSQALQAVQDVFKDVDPNPLNSGLQEAGGLTFPLFDDPSKIINILVPAAGDGQPVKFIEYTMPALSYQAGIHEFFPVIGPIGLSLDGDFAASLQLTIGYDSKGFQTGDFSDGVFLSTPPLAPGQDLPLPLPNGVPDQTHNPVAFVTASIHGGAGVGIGIASADIEGGFSGGVEAFFPNDSVLRLSDIGSGCFFDPIFGELDADVALRLTVDFGLFSWTHRIVFAETTLANFTSDCDGGIAVSDPGFALAQPNPDPVNGPDLLLNVGDRAQFRSIGGHVGQDTNEVFTITNAVTTDNILQTSALIPGVLAVNAFGVTEKYGSAANPMQTITAHLGNGDDTLNVAADVTQAINVDGGQGIDRIYGGSGNDIIHGGEGNDTLVGNGGNDQIFGEGGDDLLEGGPGADTLNGGPGFDQVTYEHSPTGVSFSPTTVNGQPAFVGTGGDAQGDTLINIEYIIGSQFDDFLWGNPNQGSNLEGLAGNDVLLGGNGNDFLLGGPGADFMFGGAGEDGTSYLTSFGGVRIDLLSHSADGGDATGDTLISIEDVQGSQYDDVLLGDNSANTLDGWRGDDIIDGRGGADIISAGDGDDIVYGGADGDTLDGGPGIDLLTYQNLAGPVTVNLRTGTGANGDRIGFITYHTDGSTTFTRFVDYSSFENLTGTKSNDNLTGDFNYNIIRGLGGDDIINGEGGNDTLIGGAGADQLIGGPGFDWASYEDSPGGVFVDLVPIVFPFTTGIGLFSDAQGDTLTDIENLRGSAHPDTLIGDDGDNEIDPGLSTLGFSAVPGAATDAGTGTPIDNVVGGGGTDTLVLDYSLDDFGQGLIGGFDFGSSDAGTFLRMNFAGTAVLDGVTFSQMEALNVIGTYHDDQIFAGSGNDFIATGGGNDLIYAGIGSDVITAQEGDDAVWYGTDANQQLSFSGGLDAAGNDALFYLDGGRGIDHLSISLAGLDTNIFLAGSDPTVEFNGTNLTLPNGSAIVNFEALDNVWTGGGNDYVAQPGYVNNDFETGDGSDIIAPGLGVDFVDGGEDFQQGVEFRTEFFETGDGFSIRNFVIDNAALQANPGDLLVLDYSSYDGSGGVIGNVSKITDTFSLFDRIEDFTFRLNLDTNQGSYTASAPIDPDFTRVDFTNIERLFVTGTNQDDLLVGTFATLDEVQFYSVNSNATVRGADLLMGLNGDDLLIGNTGSDTLIGGAGDDILIGTDPTTPTFTTWVSGDGPPGHFVSSMPNEVADQTEVDTLTGGAGADTFVLGTADGYFYASFFSESLPDTNRAIITDFNPLEGDSIQLNGFASDYFTVESNGETILYHNGVFDSFSDQLIAEIKSFTGFDLNASYVHYVGGPNGDGVEVAADARIRAEADPPVPAFAPLFGAPLLPNKFAPLDPPSWVTQDNNATDLLNALFGGSPPAGIVTESVDLVGDGRAFGTFSGDPFGIGSGIVLSTGQVADLAGPNLHDGSGNQPVVTPLTFVKIGRVGNSDILRADLSGLGQDIRSITIQDNASHVGGGGGIASGFDLDTVALSHTLLSDVNGLSYADLNNSGVLPQLNVFNFNATGLVFTPGIQRPADGSFPNGPNLDGSVNGLVDNSVATLGTFDGVLDVSSGSLSLGDGGKLQLNLNQAVSSNGPLYLYLAEAGGSGEAVNGQISVSTNGREVPTVMSTDFGASGPSGDDISFTYHFTTAAGANVNEIAFQFALFSEELPEFAGSDFNDTFKILLNGVNLAHLSNGAAASVNNLLASPHVPLSSDLILNPVGTGPVAGQTAADGYTKLLTYVGAINPGQDNTLTIEVTDVRDGFLDSGILVKAATFVAGTAPGAISVNSGAVSTGAPPDVFEGSPPISIPITIDPGLLGHLTAPVTIDFTADSHLNLGNGVGVPFEKTFNPGDPLTFNLQVSSPDDHIIDGPRFDAIDLAVHSTDPTFNGLAVAPIVVQIDDPQSMLSISDVTKAEGDVGFTAFDFTVTRTGGTAPLTVDFSTGDGSATAASGDYNFLSGTLSFAAGETAKTIEVLVNGDIYKEGDETFSVNLKNPNGAIIADGQGIGTIVNDDGASTGDTSNTPANTTVVLGTTGGTVVNTTNGRVTLTGVVNNFATGAGNDSIAGNNNNDILNGGPGNDTIRGGNGADFLIGGPGNDRMTGGLGDDTFIFRPGFGLDTITDFSVGTSSSHHDTLDLRGLGFLSAADVVNNHTADLAGTAVIHSGADTITLTNVNTALLQSHQFDILT